MNEAEIFSYGYPRAFELFYLVHLFRQMHAALWQIKQQVKKAHEIKNQEIIESEKDTKYLRAVKRDVVLRDWPPLWPK